MLHTVHRNCKMLQRQKRETRANHQVAVKSTTTAFPMLSAMASAVSNSSFVLASATILAGRCGCGAARFPVSRRQQHTAFNATGNRSITESIR